MNKPQASAPSVQVVELDTERIIEELGQHHAAVQLARSLGYEWRGGKWQASALPAAQQPAVEPVYWQWRRKRDDWSIDKIFNTSVFATTEDSEVRPLYASPTAQPAAPDVAADARSAAARDVLAERRRQVEAEGWTPEHDDEHDPGELSAAGAAYALAAADELHPYSAGDGDFKSKSPDSWPWAESWWKPGTDPRRMLVKAGALILAEIERLDRAAIDAELPAEGQKP